MDEHRYRIYARDGGPDEFVLAGRRGHLATYVRGCPFATTDDVEFERERLPDWTIRYALNRLEKDLVDFRYSFYDVRKQVFLVNYNRI